MSEETVVYSNTPPDWMSGWTMIGGTCTSYHVTASTWLEAQRQTQQMFEQQSREYHEYRKVWKEAEVKARKLFRSKLTMQQLFTLDKSDYIMIRGSKGTIYRIYCNSASENVESIDLQGGVSYCYCAAPIGVPLSDALLAQKLLIEADEDAFLEVAIRN